MSLTEQQRRVLDMVVGYCRQHGLPPTRAEIAQAMGFQSANAAEDHLQSLARKGFITLRPGTSRGIRLLQPALPADLQRPVQVGDRMWFFVSGCRAEDNLLTAARFAGVRLVELSMPMVATVAHVNVDGTANLNVIDHRGVAHAFDSVRVMPVGFKRPQTSEPFAELALPGVDPQPIDVVR